MKLETIEAVRLVIIMFLCYVPLVTLTGWFEAWVAKQMGDTVPEQSGFLTLDPFVHFNPWGFALPVITTFIESMAIGLVPFGNLIPLTPEVIVGKRKHVRILIELFARPFMHFVLMLATFIIILFAFHGYLDYASQVIRFIPSSSKLMQVFVSIAGVFLSLNKSCVVVYTFVGLFRFVTYSFFPGFTIRSGKSLIFLFLGLFVAAFVVQIMVHILLSYILLGVQSLFTVWF